MNKSTDELKDFLKHTSPKAFDKYVAENKEEIYSNDKAFEIYVKKIIYDKKLQLKDVFLQADIPEKYGYKLLSGEKRTVQRDIILRICLMIVIMFGSVLNVVTKTVFLQIIFMNPKKILEIVIS